MTRFTSYVHLPVLTAAAAALLAGCANQPAYPIAGGGSAGATGRAEAVRPEYPIAPGGSAGQQGRSGDVQVPVASAAAPPPQASATAEQGPRVGSEPVEASTLAPPPESAPSTAAASGATIATPSATPSAGVGYAELRRREDERAHAAAVERRRRLVAAKLKGYMPERREPGVRTYTLAKGDTLYGVGRRFGLAPKAVASENDLKLTGTLHPGASITLPEDARDGGHETGAKGSYVVTPGKVIAPSRAERAAALAKAERAVPAVPDLSPAPVETAEVPRPARSDAAPVAAPSPVPSAERPATAVASTRPPQPTASAPVRVYAAAPPTVVGSAPPGVAPERAPATPSAPRPYASLGPQPSRRSAGPFSSASASSALPSSRSGGRTVEDAQAAYRVAAAREAARTAVASAPQSSSTGRGRFTWPVRGAVISTFGPKGPGQRNDGVDIAATDGEAVRAAAPGEVVYAGHDVAALGNLVAVKHADGWVTIYANLQRITVHPRDKVGQGSQVGLAGTSGDAARAQVHFEVRYAPSPADKARPVDPQTVLPSVAAVG